MNKASDPNILEVTVPTIKFLGINEPTTLQLDKEALKAYVKLFVRIVVVWGTFILFRPRMAKAWKIMFGDNDEARQREVQARVAQLEAERDKATKGPAKKSYAVATGPAGGSSTTPQSAEKGSAKRRKA